MYPLRGEKGLLYEGGIRIPMFIKIPGVTEPGVKSEKLVSVVDIYPTILDLAGINITSGQKIDGYSLKPILKGEHQNELDERIHIWYNALHGIKDHNGEVCPPVAAIQKNRWKLIRKFNHSEELYDLNNDPSESVNLAKYLPQVQNHLSTLLDSCLETTGLSLPRPNPNFDPDFLMARQVPNELFYQLNLKPFQSWNGEALSAWQASNDCELTNGMDFIRMHALDGTYPRISSERLNNGRKGTFLVKIRLRITVPGGRIRFHWSEEKPENAVIELFPERNGDWEEFTGIFRTQSSLQSIGLAGPTHLGKLGFYKHGTDSRYMDVESIELFLVE
jgi:hypothetical protein